MPIGAKVIFTVAATLVLPFVLWALRPGQPRQVSSRWFKLGENDPFYYGLFNSDGRPRRYTWLGVLMFNLIFLCIVWLIPAP